MLFGLLFTRDKSRLNATIVRHEQIHVRQMWELLVVGFYLWYGVEWLVRLPKSRNLHRTYRAISFEQEAYAHEHSPHYLPQRKRFAWVKYLFQFV